MASLTSPTKPCYCYPPLLPLGSREQCFFYKNLLSDVSADHLNINWAIETSSRYDNGMSGGFLELLFGGFSLC